jgi:hypothetical protein
MRGMVVKTKFPLLLLLLLVPTHRSWSSPPGH